jgi:succinate dehydrogenase / fumarate reductase iron-sulfur subunit
MKSKNIIAKIFRYNPKKDIDPYFDEFTLPYDNGVTVLGILRYIYENIDSSLAFRNYHCGALICGCCMVTVNGKQVKSCKTVVEPGTTITIEPFKRKKVIRDLTIVF